jgi:hypothetical protein
MKHLTKIGTLALLALTIALPSDADAQGRGNGRNKGRKSEIQRRQETKGEWQRLATLGGAVALLGQLNSDKTASYIGAAGALYSLHRYEEDSKSQDRIARGRARFFGQRSFKHRGVTYDRKLVRKGGREYFCFEPRR